MLTDPLLDPSGDGNSHTLRAQQSHNRIDRGVRDVKSLKRNQTRSIDSKNRAKANVGIIVAMLLVSSVFMVALALIPSETAAYDGHDPIKIIGNDDFLPENGVVSGSGSTEDPFVISGWEILVRSGSGIAISNSSVSFVIDEVHVNGTANYSNMIYSVYLYNVSNGRIKNSLLNNTNVGVYMSGCTNCSIQQNSILAVNVDAVAIMDCVNTNIVGNYILGAGGIEADDWADSTVFLNYFRWCEMGIIVWQGYGLDIAQNFFDSCQHCTYLITSEWSTIQGNAGFGCWYGAQVSMCFNCSVVANTFAIMTATGISVNNFSFDILVAYNQLMACKYGSVWVDNCNNVVIRDNVLENGEMTYDPYGGGVFLDTNGNVSVYHNNFINNIDLQAEDYVGSENRWNDSYPSGGNYWSDYYGVDLNNGPNQDNPGLPDGIGDEPYDIDGDSRDNYPLMTIWYVNSRPISDFTVTPSSGDTTTLFELNGSTSQDPDEGVGDSIQMYRWDMDGDGNWDTDWSTENITSVMYPSPGNYTIILEVVDSNGLVSMYSVNVIVSGTVIPEFGPVFIPATVMAVALVVLATRKVHTRGTV